MTFCANNFWVLRCYFLAFTGHIVIKSILISVNFQQMRKKLITLLLLLSGLSSQAQVPEKFNYQAVIRNGSGVVMANEAMTIQIAIIQEAVGNTPVYIETHVATTNAFGMVNLMIGDGTIVSGIFSSIDWANGPYFLKILVNGTEMGTSQILTVPYALYAKEAGNGFSGDYKDLTGKPLLAKVAESGSYTDLVDKPIVFNSTWDSLSGKPDFAVVATTGSFTDLINKPTSIAGYGITDATSKARMDSLTAQVKNLEDMMIRAGIYKVEDSDGNIYNVIKIGNQVWMKENLKTTKFNDGTAIPNVTDASVWISISTPGFAWYNNDTLNKPIYGGLYNWYSVNTNKLCPTGWHVPSDEEMKTLEIFLGMSREEAEAIGLRGTDQGARLKSNTGWPDGYNGTNTTGFSALPGGFRFGFDGAFSDIGYKGIFWTSSLDPVNSAWYRHFEYNSDAVDRYAYGRHVGFSIRCVKD
jgi:uncharacterized protein (TIGR02145 family)